MINLRRKQNGLTLIELMIAIVIGIFISLMAVQYLVTSSRLFQRQGVESNIEQNASFAISYLSKYLRQAGSRDGFGTEVPFYIDACDNFVPCTSDADGTAGTQANSDRIAVQMFVAAGGRDCAGNAANGQIANVFYIAQEQPSVNSLFCRGYDVAAGDWLGDGMALIDGIEQMQVTYGVADDNERVDTYLSAANVPAVDGDAAVGWDRIRTVKVALLVSDGYQTSSEDVQSRTYQLFNGPSVALDDGVARRVFSTAVTINSKIP